MRDYTHPESRYLCLAYQLGYGYEPAMKQRPDSNDCAFRLWTLYGENHDTTSNSIGTFISFLMLSFTLEKSGS